jgi:hypothetical protein
MSNEQRIYSEDEIRAAVNSKEPQDALEIVLCLFQRATLALEGIHDLMREEGPVVLFEPAVRKDDDGLAHTA